MGDSVITLEHMSSATDVADYLLQRVGAVDSHKLQKLLYYCQAWSLVWDGAPMFDDAIEAWQHGPVVRRVFRQHKGQYRVEQPFGGSPDTLSVEARATIDAVVELYGSFTGEQLRELTHREQPWRDARGDTPADDASTAPIETAALASYYLAPVPGEKVFGEAYRRGIEIALSLSTDELDAFDELETDAEAIQAFEAELAAVAG